MYRLQMRVRQRANGCMESVKPCEPWHATIIDRVNDAGVDEVLDEMRCMGSVATM